MHLGDPLYISKDVLEPNITEVDKEFRTYLESLELIFFSNPIPNSSQILNE
jgi:hypothetical protein